MKRHPFKIRVPVFITIAVLVLTVGVSAQMPAPAARTSHGGGMMIGDASTHSQSTVSLRMAMRKLWEEHIVYTRN